MTETTSRFDGELCPTCGALPCDQTLDPDKDPIRVLLSEGLDLCIRARKLDDALLVKNMTDHFGYIPPTRSLTPWVWTQEQYDRDLADWETRARKALS